MRSVFGLDSKLGRMIYKIGQFLILSWMWILFSLPLVTMGAASTALYDVLRKLLRDEEGVLIRDYWVSFKSNFKQCTLLWLRVMLIIAVVLYVAIMYFYIGTEEVLSKVIIVVSCIFLFYFVAWIQLAFSYVARFVDNNKTVIKNVFIMCVMNPLTVLRVGGQTVLVGYFLYAFPLMEFVPLIFSLLPSVYCALLIRPVEKLFAKYIPQTEEITEQPEKV